MAKQKNDLLEVAKNNISQKHYGINWHMLNFIYKGQLVDEIFKEYFHLIKDKTNAVESIFNLILNTDLPYEDLFEVVKKMNEKHSIIPINPQQH